MQVKPRQEGTAARHLEEREYELFLPLYRSRRRWSDRIKDVELPLFPGNLLCRLDPRNCRGVVTAPGVRQIVGAGRTPIPVANEEIASVEAVVASGLRPEPWPFLRVGQRVRLEEGPLAGVEGIVVNIKNRRRLVVSVALLERAVAVSGAWIIRPQPVRSVSRSGRSLAC